MAKGYMPGDALTAPLKPELGQYVPVERFDLLRDDKPVLRRQTEDEIMVWMHRNHSFSLMHALTYEGYRIVPGARVHPHIIDTGGRPDSVTHFVCPAGVEQTGDPDQPHHINSMSRCKYCAKGQGELRAEIGL